MKRRLIPWALLVSIIVCAQAVFAQTGGRETVDGRCQVYFTPGGGAVDAVVRELGLARSEILVQAYSLSSQPIVQALLEGHKRKVAVRVILDKSELGEGMTPAALLSTAGATVLLDGRHVMARSQVIIIDGKTVMTGSFSFTTTGDEMNSEDLIVVRSEPLASKYRDNWEKHKAHSVPYGR